MKNFIKHICLIAAMFVITISCDEGFEETNTNKTAATAIDPAFQLNNAVINLSFPGSTLVYEICIIQQIVSPNSGVLAGANFNVDNRDVTEDLWQAYYRNVVRNTRDVIARTEGDADRSNLYNMARILQAYVFMILTDTYGDIPYFQGGTGYTSQVFFPVYDAQEEIYPDIISELEAAAAALSASGRIETADILYGGDVNQWKKFANSLRLRAGMRLSKVSQSTAQTVVSSAFQAGVILDNADNAVMRHSDNYTGPVGNTLNSTEAANFYMTEPFVNHLKNNNDPRLSSIAVRYVGAKSGPEQVADIASTDPEDQIGMPMGHTNATITALAPTLGLASFYDFTQIDRKRMTSTTAPVFFVTAAQTLLLLAEARERGWINAGAASDYYEDGIRAHMEQLESYHPNSAVDPADIDDYIDAHPYNPANYLEQISNEYWIASFLNGPEAWANFRRTEFPDLAPNPIPGSETPGAFIRRLTYPNSEISVNTDNVNAAIARMNGDKLNVRVWWDVAN